MKTTALNGNMVITDNGGMTIMERIKRYFAENAATITGRLPYDERRQLKRGIQNAGKIIYKSLYFRGRRQRIAVPDIRDGIRCLFFKKFCAIVLSL